LSNQLHGLQVTCAPSEYSVFNPPPNETCGSFASAYLANSVGYLSNPDSTSGCQYCPISTGDAYLQYQLGWSFDARWICVGVLIAMLIFNKIMTFVFVKWRGTGGNR
jgi:ATP-binding cassette subfamily G (WHITE) protein 2 (SNQ2)